MPSVKHVPRRAGLDADDADPVARAGGRRRDTTAFAPRVHRADAR